MKKNKMMRIASVLLVAVLLSTCAISGTFAKFTSDFTGTANARVAKWDVEVANSAETFTFDLYSTLMDDNQTDNETNVDLDASKKLIAPGTSGSFSIVVENNSEVNAKYSTQFVFKVGGVVTDLADLPFEFTPADDEGNLDMNGGTKTITVNWVWEFKETDAANTADMNLQGKTITVEAVVTVEQVD